MSDNLKEEILKEMRMSTFVALADETPDPYVAEVDEKYNDVEGETPDGETANGDINRKEFAKNRIYVDSPEEVPEGFEVEEGAQGGLYYETDEAEGDFTQEEWEQAGLEILQDFDEDDYRWDYWENPDEEHLQPGSIVHVSDEMFSAPGETEGPQGVIVDADHESGEYAVVTEDGELTLVEDFSSLINGQAEYGVTAAWDSPDQDNIREGWDDSRTQEEPEEDDSLPNWANEEALEDIESSQPPEGGIEEGELYEVGDDLEEAEQVETESKLPVYQIGPKQYSSPDGVLSVKQPSPNSIAEESSNYFEFEDGSEWEDGWYQVNELRRNEETDTVGYDVVTPSGEAVFMEGELVEGRERELEVTHVPVENTNANDVLSLPEPSGSPKPETWSVDWDNSTGGIADRPRLRTSEKKKLLREWKAAVDTEAAESVQSTIRSAKDDTYTTEGQKLDKLANALADHDGEVRSGDFEDAEDPTQEEIEAMQVLQEASQHFFEENYGEQGTISRGLASFSHESLMPALSNLFSEEGDLSEKSITLRDNPASVWSTDESVGSHFTMQGADAMDKSLMINENISSDEVINMPDSLMHYEEREETSGDDPDWNEGEINVHGSSRDIDISDVKVVGSVGSKQSVASVDKVLESPEEVMQQGERGAVQQFVRTLGEFAPEDFAESYYQRLRENEAFMESEGASKVLEEIERQQKMDKSNTSKDNGSSQPIVDIRNEADANWIYNVGDDMNKARRYVDDPSEVPEQYEVQEGPKGGLYYETDTPSDEQSQLDDFSGEEEIPDFYEADFNEYVQAFMEREGIPAEIPDDPDHDDLREAKDDWERSKDFLKELMNEGADTDAAMEVVTFAANRKDEIRRRRNNRNRSGGSNTPNAPDPVEPISEEELEEYDGEIPDDIPEEVEPMFAIADMSDSYRQFRETVNQNGMMDISNRKIHRFGRALSGDPDYELPDLGNMEDADLSGIADHDPDTAHRIQEAQEDGTITMYRAVPEFVDDIGTGDYVALNPDYVERHGENVLEGQQGEAWDVLEEEVPLEDVAWPGEDAEEFVYSPKELRERWPSTKHFYEDVSGEGEKSKILKDIERFFKERIYVDDPSEIPEGAEPKEGEQGGIYYDTDELGEGDGDDSQDSPPTPDELINTHGLDGLDEVANTIAAGILEGVNLDVLAEKIAEEKGDRYITRALKDVEKSVSKPIEGYEHPAKVVYFWDDDTKFPQEAENKFMESVDDDIGEIADRIFNGWWEDMFSDEVAPLWQAVINETGNENLLDGSETANNDTSAGESRVAEVNVSESELQAVHEYKDHVENIMREMYGDTVTVYRGIHGDAGEKLREAKERGESLEMERRPIESYSTELRLTKEYAKKPGGVVIKDEVPVEDVWASSDAGFLVDTENELAVAHDEVSEINPNNILTPEDLDDGATNIKLIGEKARELVQ